MLRSKQKQAAIALETRLDDAAVEGRSPWRDARIRFSATARPWSA